MCEHYPLHLGCPKAGWLWPLDRGGQRLWAVPELQLRIHTGEDLGCIPLPNLSRPFIIRESRSRASGGKQHCNRCSLWIPSFVLNYNFARAHFCSKPPEHCVHHFLKNDEPFPIPRDGDLSITLLKSSGAGRVRHGQNAFSHRHWTMCAMGQEMLVF